MYVSGEDYYGLFFYFYFTVTHFIHPVQMYAYCGKILFFSTVTSFVIVSCCICVHILYCILFHTF